MSQNRIDDDLLFASVREIGNRIRSKRLSPVALAEAYLDRLEKIGPKLGAVVTVMRESALKEARQAEDEIRSGKYRGPLHGIPYGVKDLVATRGVPTTWGAAPYRDRILDYDGTVIRKLRDAGAVLLAKLAMVELAGCFGYNNADASFTGPCRTPWNTDHWAGGSSSGSGSATAAGLVAFSIGSETSGSIITPAAYSGVSGLRPTYGRVSRHGAMALSWTLDKLGPMCRTADCCGLVLAAIAGRDRLDPTTSSRSFTYPEPKNAKRFRVGVFKNATTGAQPEVRQNFETSVNVLRKFCEVVEVAFPPISTAAISTIINAEGATALKELLDNGRIRELRTASMAPAGYAATMVLATDYLQAMRVRTKVKRVLDDLYAKYDAIVAPSRATVSYPVARNFDQVYPKSGGGPPIIPAGNLAGQPAISVLNGFGQHDLPTGIQFTGRAWSEGKLRAIAHAYQQATDWHTRRPKIS